MLNFTVGPVQSSELVCSIGAQQVPYFRTSEFSAVMLENERLMKTFAHAPEGSRVVFITGSGTASMEAAVMNCFSSSDRVLVVNGGSFGQRFADICTIHDIPHTQIKLPFGENITPELLRAYDGQGYTGFLVNMHETSTGVLYDMQAIGAFCKRNGIFLIVDAISAFLADTFDMTQLDAAVMITGSQKALACPPGISIITLSPKAVERVSSSAVKSMYFDLKSALSNGERGQTPFTPAVGTLLQINARLRQIEKAGGVDAENRAISRIAEDFRARIRELPFEIVSQSLSNAVTPLHPINASAYDIFLTLKDEYGIWVCPNGGELADTVFRVGHIGSLTIEDNTALINALRDMQARGLI